MACSLGKDSSLALFRMLQQGHEACALVIAYNSDQDRSWFHGADKPLLQAFAKALDIPLILCPTKAENYAAAFEKGLATAREWGASGIAFGDIDLASNRAWEEARAKACGLSPHFPLWGENRLAIVKDSLRCGFKSLFKCVNHRLLPLQLLGLYLDNFTLAIMNNAGVDACGENGEYHTLTVAGPIFRQPVIIKKGAIISQGDYSALEIIAGFL